MKLFGYTVYIVKDELIPYDKVYLIDDYFICSQQGLDNIKTARVIQLDSSMVE